MPIKQLISSILSFLPEMALFKMDGTGGRTNSPRYCYSAWLKHLVMAHQNNLDPYPSTIAELGPGDSLGMGIAALLSG